MSDYWRGYVRRNYDDYDSGRLNERFHSFVRPHLKREPQRVLDIGTGPGQYLAAISRAFPKAELVGYDIQEKFLQTAKAELLRRNISAQLICGSPIELPFENGEFDLVMSHLTLPYAQNDLRFIENAIRVLKPGGTLWLSTHAIGIFMRAVLEKSFYEKARAIAAIGSGISSMLVGWKPITDTPVTISWLKKRLNEHSMELKEVERVGYRRWPLIWGIIGRKN